MFNFSFFYELRIWNINDSEFFNPTSANSDCRAWETVMSKDGPDHMKRARFFCPVSSRFRAKPQGYYIIDQEMVLTQVLWGWWWKM